MGLFQNVAPEAPERPQGGGRRRCDDRALLAAIIFVATSGCTSVSDSALLSARVLNAFTMPGGLGVDPLVCAALATLVDEMLTVSYDSVSIGGVARNDVGTGLWTLDQLTGLVEAALAVDYPGQVNGRVRAVPDRRAIRWYATIGLVDRPAEMRGRTAVYGRRHLLQLVAIKRRQAQGRTLAEIQAELSGATDDSLETIAALPADPPESDGRESLSARASLSPTGPPAPAVDVLRSERQRFWSERPAAGPEPTRDDIGLVTAVRLADGVTVMLDHTGVPPASPGPAELAALRAAAGPLLAELARQRQAPAQPQSAHPSPPTDQETRHDRDHHPAP